MRITSGAFKGRKLKALDNPNLRPTTERVREAIFSVLNSRMDLINARVLDLFAGTGAFGFEALSRGSKGAVFVEMDSKQSDCIIKTARELACENRVVVYAVDVLTYLQNIKNELESPAGSSGMFDLVFADPPYGFSQMSFFIETFVSLGLLAKDGFFVLESGNDLVLDKLDSGKVKGGGYTLQFVQEKVYGQTRITYFKGS